MIGVVINVWCDAIRNWSCGVLTYIVLIGQCVVNSDYCLHISKYVVECVGHHLCAVFK